MFCALYLLPHTVNSEKCWFCVLIFRMLFPFILRSVLSCQQIQTRITSFRDAFSCNGSFWFQMSRNNPNRFVFQSILTFFLVFCVLNCTHALNKNCIHAPNKRTPVRFVRNVPQQSQSLRFSIHFDFFWSFLTLFSAREGTILAHLGKFFALCGNLLWWIKDTRSSDYGNKTWTS